MNYNKSHNFLTLPIFVLVPISKKELIMSKIGGGGENKIRDFILAKHISGAVDGEGLEKVGFPW